MTAPRKSEAKTLVRRMTDADLPVMQELYGEVFGPGPLELWKRRWAWQFRNSPAAQVNDARLWVAELNDEVVGMVASFPAQLWIRDRVVNIHWACDLLVARRASGFGLGMQLIKAYLESENNPLPNALLYSPGNALIHERLNYEKLWIQPVSMRPYNTMGMGRAFVDTGKLPVWKRLAAKAALPVATVAVNAFRAARRPKIADGMTVEQVERPGPEFQTLWESIRGEFPVIPVRDRAWVTWRYAEEPSTKHTILLARDRSGAPVGYTALSPMTRRGLSIGRIMDLFTSPRRPEVAETLLAAACEICEERRYDAVSCLGLHPSLRKVAQRFLFLTPQAFNQSARLLWQGDPVLKSTAMDPKAWHLSYADGDDAFG